MRGPEADLRPILRLLDRPNVDYIKSQIESGDANRTKKDSQHLCNLYRAGYRVRPLELIVVEQSIVGLLYTQSKDEKVRRWRLNAIARLGGGPLCMKAIINKLKQFSDDPQTSVIAIAAVY